MKATDKQVNGSHYTDRAIQPIEYIHANDLDFLSGNIVKYATRWPHKGQALDDLRKVIHYAELLIELQGLDEGSEPTEGCEQVEAPMCTYCECEVGRCLEDEKEGVYQAWLELNSDHPDVSPSLPVSKLKYETR